MSFSTTEEKDKTSPNKTREEKSNKRKVIEVEKSPKLNQIKQRRPTKRKKSRNDDKTDDPTPERVEEDENADKRQNKKTKTSGSNTDRVNINTSSLPLNSPFLLPSIDPSDSQGDRTENINFQNSGEETGELITDPWSNHELGQLMQLVTMHTSMTTGIIQWKPISTALRRTAAECKSKFRSLQVACMRKGPFTPEEDNIIIQTVADWVHNDRGRGMWAMVERQLRRSSRSIRDRWYYHLAPRATIPNEMVDPNTGNLLVPPAQLLNNNPTLNLTLNNNSLNNNNTNAVEMQNHHMHNGELHNIDLQNDELHNYGLENDELQNDPFLSEEPPDPFESMDLPPVVGRHSLELSPDKESRNPGRNSLLSSDAAMLLDDPNPALNYLETQNNKPLKEGEWDLNEMQQLADFYEKFKNKGRNAKWKYVAQALNRDQTECRKRFRSLQVAAMKKGTFSKEEDEIIIAAVQAWEHNKTGKRGLWSSLEVKLRRNASQIRDRWYGALFKNPDESRKVKNKNTADIHDSIRNKTQQAMNYQDTFNELKTGKQINKSYEARGWTQNEIIHLLNLVQERKNILNGRTEWTVVASMLNRSSADCRNKYRSLLNESMKKGPFTKEEDELIIKTVLEWGNKGRGIWSHLQDEMVRNLHSIRDRWKLVLAPKLNEENN